MLFVILITRSAWPRQFMDSHHGVCEEPQKDKQGFSHHRHLSSPVSDFFSSSFRNLNNRKRLACFVLLWNRLMQWLKFEYMYMLWWKFNPSLKAKILFEISTVAGNRQKESGSLCSFKNKRISEDKTNSRFCEILKHQANLGI